MGVMTYLVLTLALLSLWEISRDKFRRIARERMTENIYELLSQKFVDKTDWKKHTDDNGVPILYVLHLGTINQLVELKEELKRYPDPPGDYEQQLYDERS